MWHNLVGRSKSLDKFLDRRSQTKSESVRQTARKPRAENEVNEFGPGCGGPFHLPLVVDAGNVVFRNASGRAILQDLTYDEVAPGVLR